MTTGNVTNDKCRKRFTSYERIEEIPYMVVKKDGTRERFERSKLIAGLLKACEKRPIKPSDIDEIADRAEQILNDRPEREISGRELGALVMSELKKLDQVAYVRFASVYRDFRETADGGRPPTDPMRPLVPGEIICPDSTVVVNAGLPVTELTVTNDGPVPVHLTAHFHVFEANPALRFDRRLAYGQRLDLPSGGSVRFEPGETKRVRLVPIGGDRIVRGFSGRVDGPLEGDEG